MKLRIEGKPVLRIKLKREGENVQVVAYEPGDITPWFLLTFNVNGTAFSHRHVPSSLGLAVTKNGALKIVEESI